MSFGSPEKGISAAQDPVTTVAEPPPSMEAPPPSMTVPRGQLLAAFDEDADTLGMDTIGESDVPESGAVNPELMADSSIHLQMPV